MANNDQKACCVSGPVVDSKRQAGAGGSWCTRTGSAPDFSSFLPGKSEQAHLHSGARNSLHLTQFPQSPQEQTGHWDSGAQVPGGPERQQRCSHREALSHGRGEKDTTHCLAASHRCSLWPHTLYLRRYVNTDIRLGLICHREHRHCRKPVVRG